MSNKKPAKAKKSVRSLKAKSLSAKEARGVKGGTHNIDKASPVLMQTCATGVHMKEATITH
jgi:type VI protein secretion system component Hcp